MAQGWKFAGIFFVGAVAGALVRQAFTELTRPSGINPAYDKCLLDGRDEALKRCEPLRSKITP